MNKLAKIIAIANSYDEAGMLAEADFLMNHVMTRVAQMQVTTPRQLTYPQTTPGQPAPNNGTVQQNIGQALGEGLRGSAELDAAPFVWGAQSLGQIAQGAWNGITGQIPGQNPTNSTVPNTSVPQTGAPVASADPAATQWYQIHKTDPNTFLTHCKNWTKQSLTQQLLKNGVPQTVITDVTQKM